MQIEIIVFIIVGFNFAMVIGLNVVAYYRFKPLFCEMEADANYVAELNARIDRNIAENWWRIAGCARYGDGTHGVPLRLAVTADSVSEPASRSSNVCPEMQRQTCPRHLYDMNG